MSVEGSEVVGAGEVEVIWNLFAKLIELTGDKNIGANVGIITLYTDQVTL